MSLDVCVLASGSLGNCTIVRAPSGVLLVDAGIGPRVAAARMNGTGVAVGDVAAICLTHLDRDHFNPNWCGTILRRGIRVFCHERCADELLARCPELAGSVFGFDECFEPVPGIEADPVSLAHDEAGSHGFVLEGFGCRIGYATDLGRVPPELTDRFVDLDVLALESNYDPRMQLESARPWFLKQRIMGGRGHLSNEQAFAAVRQMLDRCLARGSRLPAHIVLLHRSRECNCPDLLRKLFTRDARVASRLTLAEQFHRTEWLRPRDTRPLCGEQLVLAWA